MGGDRPKVLMTLAGRPLVVWVVEAVRAAGIGRVIVVIGHKGELVREALQAFSVEFVWQRQLLGTGHAVLQAESLLISHDGPIAVLLGDVPRIQSETIRELIVTHCKSNASATVLTALLDDPRDLGRVVRRDDGTLDRIVEVRDADNKIKSIKEINTGAMCFYGPDLFSALPGMTSENTQGEFYLTDVISILQNRDLPVLGFRSTDLRDALGANSPGQLEELGRL
jgi:bifunctional UDP-N-acetylglucosamine pyrophosphorylase/glucosamine-1-phosphate N-acetyltransferase